MRCTTTLYIYNVDMAYCGMSSCTHFSSMRRRNVIIVCAINLYEVIYFYWTKCLKLNMYTYISEPETRKRYNPMNS